MNLFFKYNPFIAFCCFLLLGLQSSISVDAQNRRQVQQQQLYDEIQSILEILIEQEEGNVDYDTYLESLTDLSESPIDLNKSPYEKLARLNELGLVDVKHIEALLKYREEVGQLFNIYEMQVIPYWDLETIRKVRPFVTIKGKVTDVNVPLPELLFTGGKHTMFLRYGRVLEEQQGYVLDTLEDGTLASSYLGSPDKLYTRYRYKYSQKLSYGFTAEKDQGEQFFKGTQKQGFDFYSGHFYVRDVGPFKHIALGDYEVRFGQGLVAYTGLGFGKSPYVTQVKRQGQTIRPYTSVNEYNFFRGAAFVTEISKKINLTTAFSYKPVDANVVVDTITIDDELFNISSIQEGGNHRTENEYADKGAINQTNLAGELSYNSRKLTIGASAIYTKFGSPLIRRPLPYTYHFFEGDQLLNAGIHYRYIKGNIHFFGETALSNDLNGNTGWATLNGALVSLDPTIDLSLVHRHFLPTYQSIYATPFAESSTPNNETGLFAGIEIRPNLQWKIAAYFDVTKFPYLRFRTYAPSFGHDKLLQVTYKPSRSLIIYGRFDTETKGRNFTPTNDGTVIVFLSDQVTETKRTRYRLDVRYKINKTITLKSRVQVNSFEDGLSPKERGYILFQEVSYAPMMGRFSFDTRFAIFDTDSWDTRIYTYEKDVLYSFSIPPYSDRGRRFYFTLRWNINRNMTFWGRWARTTYDNREQISSGGERIFGNTKTDVKAQLRIKF